MTMIIYLQAGSPEHSPYCECAQCCEPDLEATAEPQPGDDNFLWDSDKDALNFKRENF